MISELISLFVIILLCDYTHLRIYRHTEEYIQRNKQDTGKEATTDDCIQKTSEFESAGILTQ